MMKKHLILLIITGLSVTCTGQAYWIYLEAEEYFYGSEARTQSYDKAFYLYNKAASLGNIASLRKMGVCYSHGYGVPASKHKSFVYIKKAADYGDTVAMVMLISYYLNGNGCKKSMKKSFRYAYKAANQGNEQAILFLQQFSCYTRTEIIWKEDSVCTKRVKSVNEMKK